MPKVDTDNLVTLPLPESKEHLDLSTRMSQADRTKKTERVPIEYISVAPAEWPRLRHDMKLFDSKVPEDYDWPTGEKPKLYRQALISLITVPYNARQCVMAHLQKFREEGFLEGMMFDSGGFQMFRREGYTIDRLERDNLILYKEQDWADSYVLPDFPTPPDDPLHLMEEKAKRTMEASMRFFSKLPPHIQAKAMPVFHVRTEDHLDEQIKAYSECLDASGQACYAIPGIRKKLNRKNMELMYALAQKRPDLTIHSLGVASLTAAYCMYRLGIHTYDAVSPTLSASLGLLHFGTELVSYTVRRDNRTEEETRKHHGKHRNITEVELEQLRESTGHTCPFCDDAEELKQNYDYRHLHNRIVFDEFNVYLKEFTMSNFERDFTHLHDSLAHVLNEAPQMKLF